MNTLNTFVKNLLFSALLLAPTLAHATDNTCSPSIDIKPAHGITAPKEGHFRDCLSKEYTYLVTDIAQANTRSLKAHKKRVDITPQSLPLISLDSLPAFHSKVYHLE